MSEMPAPADSKPKCISIILSFRNEEPVLPELIRRIEAALDPTGYDYELIFINDLSTDASLQILTEAQKTDPHIRILNTSTNFGVVPCLYAGFEYARGDAVVIIDCDLQDPPEIIPEMLEKWAAGAQVVHATRTRRHGESYFKMLLTKIAYRIINALSDIDLPVDTGLYKVIDRRVVDHLRNISEQNPYLRGLVTWVGFNQEHVYYEREERYAGKTHFPLFGSSPIREFLVALMSFSRVPLASILAIGALLTCAATAALAAMLILSIIGDAIALQYFAFTALILLGGIQLLALGLLGLYLGRIYLQTRGRPHYIIQSAIGFPEDTPQEK